MKKITIIILSFLLIFYSNTFVFASNTNEIHTLEVFEDGSYIEEQIDCSPTVSLFSTTSTKYGHKTATYKSSSGNTIWTITVSGIFTYNGKSSKCTKSTVTTTCVNSNWKITNKSSKKLILPRPPLQLLPNIQIRLLYRQSNVLYLYLAVNQVNYHKSIQIKHTLSSLSERVCFIS